MGILEALLVAGLLLQAGDFYTTKRILQNGGRELNPAMDWLFKKLGLTKGLLLGKAVGVIAFVILYNVGSLEGLWGLVVFYAIIVIHNAYQMKG